MSQGKIVEKVYGKQKVYVANQSHFPEVDKSELKEMERRLGETQERLKGETTECRALESRTYGNTLLGGWGVGPQGW